MLPEARARGTSRGASLHVKGDGASVPGRRRHRDRDALPADVYVTCEQCKGRRYNRETLDIEYRGKSIADVLDLTVDRPCPDGELPRHREQAPHLAAGRPRLHRARAIGHDALGCEAQRVKLSARAVAPGTGRTVYILDEPTTGLHFEDVAKLLEVLDQLVDQGNTVVVIEHNLDVVKSGDHVIDLGPEGGELGGRIVAQGTPRRLSGSATRTPGSPAGVVGRVPMRLTKPASVAS